MAGQWDRVHSDMVRAVTKHGLNRARRTQEHTRDSSVRHARRHTARTRGRTRQRAQKSTKQPKETT